MEKTKFNTSRGARALFQNLRRVGYVFAKSIELFFLLPVAACSARVFDWAWKRYYTRPLDKGIFNLCVQWLLYVGSRVNLTYTQINIAIFCVVWPVITIASIILNVVLLLKK